MRLPCPLRREDGFNSTIFNVFTTDLIFIRVPAASSWSKVHVIALNVF